MYMLLLFMSLHPVIDVVLLGLQSFLLLDSCRHIRGGHFSIDLVLRAVKKISAHFLRKLTERLSAMSFYRANLGHSLTYFVIRDGKEVYFHSADTFAILPP